MEMLSCIYRLPSPSTTGGRFCQFPTIFCFIPSSTDELVWLSGERICCCVQFSSPVSKSQKGCVELPWALLWVHAPSPTTQSVHLNWSQVQRCPDVAWSQPPKLKDPHTNHISNRPQNSIASRGKTVTSIGRDSTWLFCFGGHDIPRHFSSGVNWALNLYRHSQHLTSAVKVFQVTLFNTSREKKSSSLNRPVSCHVNASFVS